MRNPGQVFSRDQLLEKVWGYDYAGETRTVDVHVHWLRSAIEADPSQPRYLQTIRGTGYVLRLPGRAGRLTPTGSVRPAPTSSCGPCAR